MCLVSSAYEKRGRRVFWIGSCSPGSHSYTDVNSQQSISLEEHVQLASLLVGFTMAHKPVLHTGQG